MLARKVELFLVFIGGSWGVREERRSWPRGTNGLLHYGGWRAWRIRTFGELGTEIRCGLSKNITVEVRTT